MTYGGYVSSEMYTILFQLLVTMFTENYDLDYPKIQKLSPSVIGEFGLKAERLICLRANSMNFVKFHGTLTLFGLLWINREII